jgi:hypothetical protein
LDDFVHIQTITENLRGGKREMCRKGPPGPFQVRAALRDYFTTSLS